MPVDISLVVTVYNKAWALPRVWESLLKQQGGLALEFVFVDDCSTDGSIELLRGFAQGDPRVKLVTNTTNAGPSIRVNQGIETAAGRFVAFLDGDDLAPPNSLSWMHARLQQAHAPMIWGTQCMLDGDEPAAISDDVAVQVVDVPLAFAATRCIVCSAGMADRDLCVAAGGADPTVFVQDLSLSLRLASKAPRMVWTDAALALALEPAGNRKLSDHRMQLRHDAFFAVRNVLAALDGHAESRPALTKLAVRMLWKARKHCGVSGARFSLPYVRNFLVKGGWLNPDLATLDRWAAPLARRRDIRRTERISPHVATG